MYFNSKPTIKQAPTTPEKPLARVHSIPTSHTEDQLSQLQQLQLLEQDGDIAQIIEEVLNLGDENPLEFVTRLINDEMSEHPKKPPQIPKKPSPKLVVKTTSLPLMQNKNLITSPQAKTPTSLTPLKKLTPVNSAKVLPKALPKPDPPKRPLKSPQTFDALQPISPGSTQARLSGDFKTIPFREWNTQLLLDWLKGEGFGEDVLSKFRDQAIMGSDLPDLSDTVLRDEFGFKAFGIRNRIKKAITQLVGEKQ